MGARSKLNTFILVGVLAFAALTGAATQSVLVFLLVAAIGAGLMVHAGGVRLAPTGRSARIGQARRLAKHRR